MSAWSRNAVLSEAGGSRGASFRKSLSQWWVFTFSCHNKCFGKSNKWNSPKGMQKLACNLTALPFPNHQYKRLLSRRSQVCDWTSLLMQMFTALPCFPGASKGRSDGIWEVPAGSGCCTESSGPIKEEGPAIRLRQKHHLPLFISILFSQNLFGKMANILEKFKKWVCLQNTVFFHVRLRCNWQAVKL